MKRSISQAVYKYLPNSWCDYKSESNNLSGFIKSWNERDLDINAQRAKNSIRKILSFFDSHNGITSDFGSKESLEFSYKTVSMQQDFADIVAELSPLIFYCSKCGKVHSYQNQTAAIKSNFKCSKCKSKLNQLQFVYSCACGYTSPVKMGRCPNHDYEYIVYEPSKNSYAYSCSKCNHKVQLQKKCPVCGVHLNVNNVLDNKNFYPFSTSMIEFLDNDFESKIYKDKTIPSLVIANYLEKISVEEYNTSLKTQINPSEIEKMQNDVDEKFSGLPLDIKNKMLEMLKKTKFGDRGNVDQVLNNLKNKLYFSSEKTWVNEAIQLKEYLSVKEKKVYSTEEIFASSDKLNLSVEYNDLPSYLSQTGISLITLSNKVQISTLTFGYTRKHFDPEFVEAKDGLLRMKPFFGPDGIKRAYGYKYNTEGLLIEFDRKKIVQWLYQNNIIKSSISHLPDEDLKIWFLNNIDADIINLYGGNDTRSVTGAVYNLIHSISHSLIRSSSEISGLDQTSIGEYIFVNVPAIFIYSSSSQGNVLGSFMSVFHYHLIDLINKSLENANNCLFDPFCISNNRACLGCLHIPDIACTSFNKNLNRGFLVGYTEDKEEDSEIKKNIVGFW